MKSSADGQRGRVVWITGAGSGMGEATALRAAEAGWNVILTGRRKARLEEVATAIARQHRGRAVVAPADVTDAEELGGAFAAARDELGPPTAVVAAAGLNTPRRRWSDQTLSDFDRIVRTNLTATAATLDLALPDLRRAAGVAIVISSYSAWRFSPVAGVAYSASKAGLGLLCETLNAQEGEFGVRACHLCPGDVDTDFLALRPVVPDTEQRSRMLVPDDVARAALLVLDAPAHIRIDELVMTPAVRR